MGCLCWAVCFFIWRREVCLMIIITVYKYILEDTQWRKSPCTWSRRWWDLPWFLSSLGSSFCRLALAPLTVLDVHRQVLPVLYSLMLSKSQVVDHRIQTDCLNTLLFSLQNKTVPGGGDTTCENEMTMLGSKWGCALHCLEAVWIYPTICCLGQFYTAWGFWLCNHLQFLDFVSA